MNGSRRIRRVTLRQYKSIESCDIELASLTILAGRNGVGKSNIIDALRFVADALNNPLEYAIRKRGGIDQVRRKSLGGRPTNPGVGVELELPDGRLARYSFRIAAVHGRAFRIDHETCEVCRPGSRTAVEHAFSTRDGSIVAWTPFSAAPAVAEDRLLLVAASGLTEFRGVFDVLSRMVFHNFNPEAMKLPQRPEPGARLSHDGQNLASVVKQLSSSPDRLNRVIEYLRAIGVPVTRIEHKQAGALETFEVAQEQSVPEGVRNSTFEAISLSDGTIRALGILVSLLSAQTSSGPSLIGIEEPETALHPAAAGALMDALLEGSESTQLIITCHSPDLLEHPSVVADMIRPVLMEKGRTRVGRLDPLKAKLLADHLSTPGELLRLDQLTADQADLDRQDKHQGSLFGQVA